MLSDLRRAQILADAREQGGVSLRELSHRFEVSIPTIRRDLSALADQGLVRRVHGGAIALRAERGAAAVRAERGAARLHAIATATTTATTTAATRAPARSGRGTGVDPDPGGATGSGVTEGVTDGGVVSGVIGGVVSGVVSGVIDGDVYVARRVVDLAGAAALVTPGMAIGLSGGPAAVRLAGLLDDVPGLTVVTPVPAVAAAIVNRATVVVLVGGVRTPSGSHAGPLAQATLAQLNLDLAVVELRDPATTGDALAAQTDLALVQRATAAVFLNAAETATGSRPRSG